MRSRVHTQTNEKLDSKQRSAKSSVDDLETVATQRTPLQMFTEGGGGALGFLSPRDVLQLQRTIGNRATCQFLARVAESQSSPRDESDGSSRKNTEPRSLADGIQRLEKPAVVQMVKAHGTPELGALPRDRAPTPAERANIVSAINLAAQRIDDLLTTARGTTCINRSFRTQAAVARTTFQAMRTVLAGWKTDIDTRVVVSDWLACFGREANTEGQDTHSIITLPVTLLRMPQQDLIRTLIHEASHGAGGAVMEDKRMIGTNGFRTLADTDRLNNAYHFDGTARAYAYPDHEAYLTANVDPPALVPGGAGVGGGGGYTAMFQKVYGQLEQMLLGARIHSENMYEEMVRLARADKPFPRLGWWQVAPMKLPSEKSWWPNPDVQVEDIEKAKNIVTSIQNAHNQFRTLNIQEVGPEHGLSEKNVSDIQGNALRVFSYPGVKLIYTPDVLRRVILQDVILPPNVIPGSDVDAEMVDQLSLIYHKIRTPRTF